MQTHSTNPVNGHHHEMQMNSYGVPTTSVNGYSMNLKQEPDMNF